MSGNSIDTPFDGPAYKIRPPWRWALALTGLALAVRLCGLNKSIWTDEGSTLAVLHSANLLEALRNYDHPPLYFLLLKAWSVVSSADPFLRLFSVLLSAATVPVVMRWIAYYDCTAAILAGLCVALMPGMLASGHEIRGYSLLLLATAFSFLEAHRFALHPSWRRALTLAAALSVAVSTHLAGAILLASVAAYTWMCAPTVIQRRQQAVQSAVAFALPASCFALIYFVFMSSEVRNRSAAGWWMPRPDAHVIGGVLSQLTWTRSWVWLKLAWATAHPLASRLALAALALTWLLLLVAMLWGKWRTASPLLVGAITHNLLLLLYSFIRLPIFGVRTALPSILCLIGFFCVQGATASRRNLRLVAVASSVGLSLASGLIWVSYQAWIPEEPAVTVANVIRQEKSANDLVLFFPSYVEGLIRHYDTDLASKDIVQGGRMNNALVGEAYDPLDLTGVAGEIQRLRPHAVFLVSRADSLAQHSETYEAIRSALAAELSPATPRQFGSLWVSRFDEK